MIFISFGAVAKEYKYKCSNLLFKVEDPLFGKRKLYVRNEGKWEKHCTKTGSQINNDSFNCIVNGIEVKSFILDEVTKT